MRFSKKRSIPTNNKNKLSHFKFASNDINLRQNCNLESFNYNESISDLNYLSNINNKNEGIRSLKSRINSQISKNQDNYNRINNYLNKNNVKGERNLLTENMNNINNANKDIIINDYSPNFSSFDNNFQPNQKQKINYGNIPHLKLKKLENLRQFNTEEKNFNYNSSNDLKFRKNNNNSNPRKKLVINTFRNEAFNDNNNENIKIEYDKKSDFHKYLRMGSYFNNSHSKNKRNKYEINYNYGNQTERIRTNFLLDGKDKNINSLILQSRMNNLKKNKLFKNNDEQIGDNYYYNNTMNNYYTEIDADFNYDNNYDFGNDYLTQRNTNMIKIFDNKINKKNLSSLLNSDLKENKDNDIKSNAYNNKKPYKSIIVIKKKYKNGNYIRRNDENLKISKFGFSLSSKEIVINEINNTPEINMKKDGIFLIKNLQGKNVYQLEINDKNIEKINNYFKEENIITNYRLIKLDSINDLNEINLKNLKLEEEFKKMEEKVLLFQEKNSQLINENNNLMKENESLKKSINDIKNNKIVKENPDKNIIIDSELKEKKDEAKDNKSNLNIQNEEYINIFNEKEEANKDINYREKYKRRKFDYINIDDK